MADKVWEPVLACPEAMSTDQSVPGVSGMPEDAAAMARDAPMGDVSHEAADQPLPPTDNPARKNKASQGGHARANANNDAAGPPAPKPKSGRWSKAVDHCLLVEMNKKQMFGLKTQRGRGRSVNTPTENQLRWWECGKGVLAAMRFLEPKDRVADDMVDPEKLRRRWQHLKTALSAHKAKEKEKQGQPPGSEGMQGQPEGDELTEEHEAEKRLEKDILSLTETLVGQEEAAEAKKQQQKSSKARTWAGESAHGVHIGKHVRACDLGNKGAAWSRGKRRAVDVDGEYDPQGDEEEFDPEEEDADSMDDDEDVSGSMPRPWGNRRSSATDTVNFIEVMGGAMDKLAAGNERQMEAYAKEAVAKREYRENVLDLEKRKQAEENEYRGKRLAFDESHAQKEHELQRDRLKLEAKRVENELDLQRVKLAHDADRFKAEIELQHARLQAQLEEAKYAREVQVKQTDLMFKIIAQKMNMEL
eukprot:jgi/Mesvir1/27632/Mv07363-RA.1